MTEQQHKRAYLDDDELEHAGRDRNPESVYAQIEKRRVAVQQLWSEGMSQRLIAHSMSVSLRTVQRDLEAIRMELATEQRSMTTSQRQDKHLAAVSAIKGRAYVLLNQLKDVPTAQNRVGALKILLECEQEEARLDGSALPHAVSARVASVFQDAVLEVLLEVGGPRLVRQVAERLRERIRTGDPGVALLGGITQRAEQQATTVEADDSDANEAQEEAS
jgi:hypothetical protein